MGKDSRNSLKGRKKKVKKLQLSSNDAGSYIKNISFLFQENFMEVIRNQEFLLLPATEIAKLLASDDMNIPNEETILNALLTWVRHDLEQRRKDLSKLLAYIRLPLLAPQVNCSIPP